MPYKLNANYILFSHVVRNRMLGALERLCANMLLFCRNIRMRVECVSPKSLKQV